MADKKITDLQLISAITDALNLPVDNTLQTYRATIGQIKEFFKPVYLPPLVRRLTSGSGTLYRGRAFICTGANITAGDTYTHNSVTWTAIRTCASSNVVYLYGNGTPLSSGTLTRASGTGDATINFTEYRDPLAMKAYLVGGGGGGGGAGTGASAASDGNDTTFTSNLTAGKGIKGGSNGGGPGAGGSNTVSSTTGLQVLKNVKGGSGQYTGYATSTTSTTSGLGGVSSLGGNGEMNNDPAPNSGCGGGGGANNGLASSSSDYGGDGGGAGGTLEILFSDAALAASYSYAVGAGGAGGNGAGTGRYNGKTGATGVIEIEERWQ